MNATVKKQMLGVTASLIAGASIFAVMLATGEHVEPQPRVEQPQSVRVTEVTLAPLQLTVKSQGEFRPRTQSEFISEVSGAVTWLSPTLSSGSAFKKGDILARLDDRDYQSALESTRSVHKRAESELALASAEFERIEQLYQSSLVSKTSYDSAKRSFDVASAALREANAGLSKATRDLEKTELVAPFNGVVRERHIDLGQFVSRGQGVASLYANDSIEVRLPIADNQVRYLDLAFDDQQMGDASVRLSAVFGGVEQHWSGELLRTEAEIDSRTRMITAVVGVNNSPNEQGLPPVVGLFVSATISGKQLDNATMLPRLALRDDSTVAIVDADNRVELRKVNVLRIQNDQLVIDDGLVTGDRVIVSGVELAVSGMLVAPYDGL